MKKGLNRNKIIYGIVSVLCFLVLFGVTYSGRQLGANGCDIVMFGDSVLGECRDTTSIPAQLETMTGKSVFNGALGGTCMSRNNREMRLSYIKDSLSIVALAEALATEDLGVQQTARVKEAATEYFEVTIDGLNTIDFNKVETIIIGAGVNDYHAGTPIYPQKDAYDEYTFVGALRSVIRDIREAYPNIRIVLMTPTYTWYREKNLTCEAYDLGGGSLEAYVNAELQVAEEMGVEVIDLYHDFYPHEQWEDWEIYSRDGLHPNEAGRELIAKTIAEFLKK